MKFAIDMKNKLAQLLPENEIEKKELEKLVERQPCFIFSGHVRHSDKIVSLSFKVLTYK